MDVEAWILTAGRYDDKEILGVVIGPRYKATLIASRLTTERTVSETSRDMIYVEVNEARLLED
jgi:hypothetical protein